MVRLVTPLPRERRARRRPIAARRPGRADRARAAPVRPGLSMQYILPFILAMVVTMAWLAAVRAPRAQMADRGPAGRAQGAYRARFRASAASRWPAACMVAALATIDLQAPDRWFLVAAGVLVVFGALDDRLRSRLPDQAAGPVIAVAIVVFLGGVQIHRITLDDRVTLPAWIAVPLTVLFPRRRHQCRSTWPTASTAWPAARHSCVCARSRCCRASAIGTLDGAGAGVCRRRARLPALQYLSGQRVHG